MPNSFKFFESQKSKFTRRISNSAEHFFAPILTHKPNCLTPLSVYSKLEEDYTHPYKDEIETFLKANYQKILKLPTKPFSFPKPLEKTPFVFVDTKSKLKNMVNSLAKSSILSIDLENNNFNSYLGITCIMQISTIEKDYIIDTIKLYDEMQILNEITTNSKIEKVVHSGFCDIEWLQRDFGIYIVNLFDTQIAVNELKFEKNGLSFLLSNYCNYKTNKKYQLADWRARPLNPQMIIYARADTHFLIYLRNVLIKMLLEKNKDLLKNTFISSNKLCLHKYKKKTVNLTSLKKYGKKIFVKKNHFLQRFVFKKLYFWIDSKARVLDVSNAKILSIKKISKIINNLPQNMGDLNKTIDNWSECWTLELKNELMNMLKKTYKEQIYYSRNPKKDKKKLKLDPDGDFSFTFCSKPKNYAVKEKIKKKVA